MRNYCVNAHLVCIFVLLLSQSKNNYASNQSMEIIFNTYMPMETLSKTEYRVAKRVARGLSEKEIAAELFVSEHTVHSHTYRIRKKWKARSAVDICRMFILKLDNPKHFFTALVFLSIQYNIIFNGEDMVLRRPVKTSVKVRTGKTGRKKRE